GIISTAVGSGSGDFGSISLSSPNGLCIDGDGDLLIADVYNYRVRKLAFPYYYLNGTPDSDDIGNNLVTITANDGTTSNFLEFNLEVLNVNDPPRIVSTTDINAIEDQPFLYIGLVSDPDDSLFSWQFVDYPSWLTVKNDSIYGTPTQNDTSSGFILIVSDGEYYDTINVSITLTLVNDIPKITSVQIAQATEDEYFIYTCTATDEERDRLNYSFSQLPHWLTADADSVFGTPLEADGDTIFLVIVSDQFGSDSLTVSVHVISVNDPPLFSTIPDTGFAEDNKLVLLMNTIKDYVSDPDTPDSSLVIDIYYIRPLTVNIQNDSIEISAEADWFGVDTIRLIVRDDILADTTQFALTVYPVNDAPVFSDLMIDSFVLSQGETDSISVKGFVTDIDTPDSLLHWNAIAGKFVDCQWLDSLKLFQVSVNSDSVGLDTIYFVASDGEFRIDAAIIVIVNPSTGLNNIVELPKTYALKQNYPNPFNPTTIIPYDLPQESHVDIRIYDLCGREVFTLMTGQQPANHYQISWDGRDKNGVHVASGVYLYRMTTTSENQHYSRTRKLMIIQ
ncbi:MAG: T9SS type A sorting domain-containing protein, partial [Candidatus Marinimicrobia bacterium]|nr:T9SS type A sorting domain-containing protein [Candidatus Neomarinimicrobiota bacterium]